MSCDIKNIWQVLHERIVRVRKLRWNVLDNTRCGSAVEVANFHGYWKQV